MKLLTKELEKKIPPLYSQEKVKDPMVVAKFFCPWGSATWWIIEGKREDDDYLMFGLCMLFTPQEAELGYISLNELASVTGPFGLKIERDMYWEPVPLSKIKEKLG
jgi:hypothetical protein